jgi:3-hydroxybutyryl-CoA dehydrogenase
MPSKRQSELVAGGRLGRKSGRGVYDYAEGAAPPTPNLIAPLSVGGADIRVSPKADAINDLLNKSGVMAAVDAGAPDGFASIGHVLVGFSDGRSARATSMVHKQPVAILDWLRDPASATCIAFSASDEDAAQAALALAAACGKKAARLADRPGLIVFRTLAQLANAAADAVADQVADAGGVDRAMRFGANYPFSPLEWARSFGFTGVAQALDVIARETGDPMYRAIESLRTSRN